jgi:hypothetical protein
VRSTPYPASMDGTEGTSKAHRTIAWVAALVCLLNLVIIAGVLVVLVQRYDAMDERFAGVSAGEDIAFPFVPILLFQAALNGVALALWEPSRRVGQGILIGTVTATVAAGAWWYLLLLTSFQ